MKPLVAALLLFSCAVAAQPGHSSPPGPAGPPGQSAGYLDGSSASAAFFQNDSLPPAYRTKDPWLAVGFSAVLPGAGQVYDENYWKVPIIWGLGGYWTYEYIQNNKSYKEYRDLYNESVEASPPNGDQQLLSVREFYKDQRDSFAWLLGILYFLNLVDAYVGAHLYDFDVGPDLGYGTPGVHSTMRFEYRW